MKPLALAFVSVLVAASTALQAQAAPSPSEGLAELKKKYSAGGQAPDAATDSTPPSAVLSVPALGSKRSAPRYKRGAMPALYARSAPGADGYTLAQLIDNLNWTEQNLSALVDYLHPWKEGVAAPSAEDAAAANTVLAEESAAASRLAVEGDAALAKGIPRDPLDPDRWSPHANYYPNRATFIYDHPTAEQRLQSIASAQCNVLAHMASLIAFKRLNPPNNEKESTVEGWLERARRSLAEAETP